MGSKFLESDSTDLSALTDGTFNLNISSAVLQSLAPNLPVRTTGTRQLTSALIQLADCAFTPLTNPATANLNLAGYAVSNVGTFSGATNSRTADDILSCSTAQTAGNLLSWTVTGKVAQDSGVVASNVVTNSGTATSGRVATFSSDKVIQDGGTLLSDLATTASLANYLLKSGGTMTGSINMGAQTITNVSSVSMSTSNINVGSNSTIGASVTNNINIGNNTAIGFGADTNVVIGQQASVNSTSSGNVIVGYLSSSALGGYNTILGQQSTARGNAVAIGKESYAGAGARVMSATVVQVTYVSILLSCRPR